MHTSTDILIAGGSYAGLALAACLSHQSGGDLAVTVVSPSFPPEAATAADIRASALSRGSLHLLQTLGVWSALAPHTEPVTAIDLTDSALTDALRPTVFSCDLAARADAPATLPAMVILANHYLGAALHSTARARAGITLAPGVTVVAMTAEHTSIRVELSSGDFISARLLVAADGGRSRVRTLAGIKTIGWPYDQRGIITVVTPELPHQGRATQHFFPNGPVALLPMTGQRICVTWSEEQSAADHVLALPPADFRAAVEQHVGAHLGALHAMSPPQSWPLDVCIARTMIAQRVALVGDAAHTVHPIAGQGLNLGLRDVAALTQTIIDAASLGLDFGHATHLQRYERWRRFDNLAASATFDTLNRSFSQTSTLARSARGAVLSVAGASRALKSWLVSEATGATGDVPRLLLAPSM